MKWLRKKTSPQRLVGMAVESGGLTAVTLGWVNGRLEIDQSSFIPDQKSSLRDWVANHQLDGAPCYLVLSPAQIEVVQVEKPLVAEEEIRDAAVWLVRDSIQSPIEDVIVDIYDVPEGAGRSSQPTISVVVARRQDVQAVAERVAAAGLKLQSIDIPELVYRNVAKLYAPENGAISMLVLDEKAGSILLFKNDDLYFSRQIALNEELFSQSDAADHAIDQLCLEVQRTLDYFESQMRQAAPSSLLVYAVDNLPKLGPGIASKLPVDVHMLELDKLGIDVGTRRLEANRTATVRAIGAALRQGAQACSR